MTRNFRCLVNVGTDVNLESSWVHVSDGYAPFSSMTGRESCIYPTDNVIAAPGPGQYDPREPQNFVKVKFILFIFDMTITPPFSSSGLNIVTFDSFQTLLLESLVGLWELNKLTAIDKTSVIIM